MLKKAIFTAALGIGFLTSFHVGRTAVGAQPSIQIKAASEAAACPDSCDTFACWCHCWGC